MKRYDLEDTHPGTWESYYEMVEKPDGEWVQYSEAEARIKELEEALKAVDEWESFGNHIDDEIINQVKKALYERRNS